MKPFAGFDVWHNATLKDVCSEASPDPAGVNATCRELKVLPLTFDMSGCFAIRANGEIVSFLFDNQHELRVETDPRIRNMALFQGSKRYPELAAMIPPKPDDAIECSRCDGTGIEKTTAKLGLENVVCYCGGLGWIPSQTTGDVPDEPVHPEKPDWRFNIPTVLCSVGASIIRDEGVSPPKALLIAGSVAFLLDYWIPPKKDYRFWQHAVLIEYVVFGLVLSVYYLPVWLADKMPPWLSTGVFTFLFLIGLYFLQKAIKAELRTENFKKFLLFSLGAAVVFACWKALFSIF